MKIFDQVFILNRTGLVSLAKSSSNQCKSKDHLDYEYTVRLECLNNLDKDGFVIDHKHIHDSVLKVFKKNSTSCEELCLLVERELRKTMEKYTVRCRKSYIKIRPISILEPINAFMELETEYFYV